MVKKSTKSTSIKQAWLCLAVVRILLGFTFLWAFFDKLIGLNYATAPAKAWLAGGSPTTGFLSHVGTPFANMFSAMTNQPFVDILFMFGLLGLGLALILGIGIRVAAVAGSVMYFLMYLASGFFAPKSNNPIIDDHIIHMVLLWTFAAGLSEQRLSIAKWWQSIPFVKKNPWLW